MKTPIEVEKEKKEQRALRFGKQDIKTKLLERAKRFNLVSTDEEIKKQEIRKQRFSLNQDKAPITQQKLSERAKRFGILDPKTEKEKKELRKQRFGLSSFSEQEKMEMRKNRFEV